MAPHHWPPPLSTLRRHQWPLEKLRFLPFPFPRPLRFPPAFGYKGRRLAPRRRILNLTTPDKMPHRFITTYAKLGHVSRAGG
jgi:hypothetical protein